MLNKVHRVPPLSECPSVLLSFDCPLSDRVPKYLSAQVSKCLECLEGKITFECSSASGAKAPKFRDFPSAIWVAECLHYPSPQVPWVLECSSTQLPFEYPSPLITLITSGTKGPKRLECLKIWSASESQLVSQQVS